MPNHATEGLISPYDEMVTGEGSFRSHWRPLLHTLRGLSPVQLAEKQARSAAQLAEADTTVAGGPRPAGRAGGLDLLPLILPAAEWRTIAAGVTQRARLLNAILDDVYGEQRLLAERRLPPSLIFGNPAFLRQLRHVMPASSAPQLYFFAVDLIRLASGEWRVFADRTQAAAGVGYALHHRRVLARSLPEAFRAVAVRPLQQFVEAWRASLQAIGAGFAPDRSHIALLTPGSYNDAYFEHVFLARELGITLVQSADLTVRGDFVFLKTLQGLVRIDVIYRRVDGDYCDSLELREESALGVAGLVEVARKGHVAILNMPGTAVVGTPALTAFLPALARLLLGEELRLPAVTTWWCGQRHALHEVRGALNRFVLQPVFAADPELIEPVSLSAERRAAFEAELAAHPARFVARERMTPSEAPCLAAEELRQGRLALIAKPVVLRAICIWHDGDWHAMPGGVARVVAEHSIYRSAPYANVISKDVWVLAEDEEADLAARPTALMQHAGPNLQPDRQLRSRTADDLYWLGRYVERLDHGARLFAALLRRLAAGSISARAAAELTRLATALRRSKWVADPLALTPADSRAFLDGMIEAAMAGAATRATIDAIVRLATATSDQLSPEMGHTLNRLAARAIARFATGLREPGALSDILQQTISGVAAFSGFAAEDMVRGPSWRFLDLGRRIERGVGTAQAIGGVLAGPVPQTEAGLRLALELCDVSGGIRHLGFELNLARTLNFVLAERNNPRSLVFQIEWIEQHLVALGEHSRRMVGSMRVAGLAAALSGFADTLSDDRSREDGVMDALFKCLGRATADLTALSDEITREFFSQVAASHLVSIGLPVATAFEAAQ